MKNLHYRTQSLPEAVYTNHMLQMAHQDYHQSHLQAINNKLHSAHHLSAIKKRNNLRRSQTNVCDIVPSNGHHRAPLTAGVYEAFLPPPNLNAIGLPVGASNLNYPSSRTQSFYVPNHHRSSSLSHHGVHQMGSQHNLCRSDQMLGNYPINHTKAMSQRDIGMLNEQKNLSQSWYHRSVPNISQPMQTPPSLTTPLFVDCSVEYDLGDHPPVPANSEPLLSIHPEFVVKSRSVNSSPYSMYQSSSNHIRSGKLKGISPKADKSENHKSLPDIQASYGRRIHQQRYGGMARRAIIPRSSPNPTDSSKMEATRKLSVESRDSGICLLNSAGNIREPGSISNTSNPWVPTSQNCDTSLCLSGGQLPQQIDYNNKIISANNKRFAFTDLVTGLLCCSTPGAGGYRPDLNMSLPDDLPLPVDIPLQADWRLGVGPWRDVRTMDWVQEVQGRALNPAYCSQDCGDGFCYNVWSNMVHV